MDLTFSKDDVRRHLHDLGYRQVSEEALQEFMADLTRLIKHEERHRATGRDSRKRAESTPPRSRRDKETAEHGTISTSEVSSAYGSSESLVEEQRSRRRTVVVARPKGQNRKVAEKRSGWQEQSQSSAGSSRLENSGSDGDLVIRVAARSAADHEQDEKQRPQSANRFSNARPTTSFIRPARLAAQRRGVGTRGRENLDPVRLYQHYQSIWNRTKFPGDDSSKAMRWAVREWMMGQDK